MELQKILPHPIASDTLKFIPDKAKRTKANQVSESEVFSLFFHHAFAAEVSSLDIADVFWDYRLIPSALLSLPPRAEDTVFCYGQTALHRRK